MVDDYVKKMDLFGFEVLNNEIVDLVSFIFIL